MQPCRFGASCYRTNAAHLQQFSHPQAAQDSSAKRVAATDQGKPAKKAKKDAVQIEAEATLTAESKRNTSAGATEVGDSLLKLRGLSPAKRRSYWQTKLCQLYGVTFPEDFFDLWDLALEQVQEKGSEEGVEQQALKWMAAAGVVLCGPFEVMAGCFHGKEDAQLHLHWRFLYDPPEFHTVARATDADESDSETDALHWGYFRDSPDDLPVCVGRMGRFPGASAKQLPPRIIPQGATLFNALHAHAVSLLGGKSAEAKAVKAVCGEIRDALQQRAKAKGHAVGVVGKKDKRLLARNKLVVGPTFNGMGLVVPFEDDVGYRDLPYSDKELANIFSRMERKFESGAEVVDDKLEELLTWVTFANDECDPGMGLQVGIDLFCAKPHRMLQKKAYRVLTQAYSLLGRGVFEHIAKQHIRHRYRTHLDQLQLEH